MKAKRIPPGWDKTGRNGGGGYEPCNKDEYTTPAAEMQELILSFLHKVCVHSFLAKGQGRGFSDRQAEIRVFPQRRVALLKFQVNKGTVSGHALQPYFIGKCGVTITFRAFSDRLRDFRGAQRGSRVLRLFRFVFGKRR